MLQSHTINGYIYLRSGLRIGGNKDTMQIGGIDSPVIKNPITGTPYIPGSSLKGKMRFLLEAHYGLISPNGRGAVPGLNARPNLEQYSHWENNKIALIFGHLNHATVESGRPPYPTRVIFRDCNVEGAIEPGTELNEGNINRDLDGLREKMASNFSEAKIEVAIDRLSGTVGGSGPRTLERIPAGVVFDFSLTLRLFEEDEGPEFLEILKQGLKLLQNDALGGSGSRGYGRIEFFGLKIDGEAFSLTDN